MLARLKPDASAFLCTAVHAVIVDDKVVTDEEAGTVVGIGGENIVTRFLDEQVARVANAEEFLAVGPDGGEVDGNARLDGFERIKIGKMLPVAIKNFVADPGLVQFWSRARFFWRATSEKGRSYINGFLGT